MPRNVDLTDGGQLRFYENQESTSPPPQDKISFEAPDGVTEYRLHLPPALVQNAYLKTAGTTSPNQLSWTTTAIGFNWKNILDYAATRGADSSGEIENAIDAAIASNEDCVVYIPEGTFWLDTTITAPFAAGVTVKFIGANPEKSVLLLKGSAAAEGIDATANLLKRIEFHNIQFDCNAMGTDPLSPSYERSGEMLALKADEIVVENCIFQNIGYKAALQIEEANTFARVHNCIFRDIYTTAESGGGNISGHCIDVTTTGSIASLGARPTVSVRGNQFLCADSVADSGAGAIVLEANFSASGNPRNLIFADNYVYQCGDNLVAVNGALDLQRADDAVIRNNIFAYSTGSAITCVDSQRVQVVDNKFLGESVGWNTTRDPSMILFSNAADAEYEDLVIRDNIFESVDSTSAQLSATYAIEVVGDADAFSRDIVITGNRFDKLKRGIYIKYAYGDIRIEDNDFINLYGADADHDTPVNEDACIYLGYLQGPDATTDQTNVRIASNSCDDCLGRFVYFTAQDVDNKRSFWVLDNRWETKTAASVFNEGGVITLIGGANDRIENVRLAGNSYRGLPSVTTEFSYVSITGVANRFDAESVYEFGATGDGSTDDTRAIVQAFTQLDGNKIVIPAGGTFYCSSIAGVVDIPLTITKSNTLVTGGGTLKTGANYTQTFLSIGHGSDHVENVTVQDIDFQTSTDAVGTCIKTHGDTEYVAIRDCKIGNQSSDTGVRWDVGVIHTATGGFLSVSGCDISADNRGVETTDGSEHHVVNNRIDVPVDTGVFLQGASGSAPDSNCVVSNNTISAPTGVKLTAMNHCVVSGNAMSSSGAGSIGVQHTGGATGPASNTGLNISANVSEGYEKAIVVDGATTKNWTGLTISSNTHTGGAAAAVSGIHVTSAFLPSITCNNLRNCADTGGGTGAYIFLTDCLQAVVSSNVILASGGSFTGAQYGIWLKATAAGLTDNCLITGNSIQIAGAVTNYAYFIGDASVDVDHTTIANNNIGSTTAENNTTMDDGSQTSSLTFNSHNVRTAALTGDTVYLRATIGGDEAGTGGDAASTYYLTARKA